MGRGCGGLRPGVGWAPRKSCHRPQPPMSSQPHFITHPKKQEDGLGKNTDLTQALPQHSFPPSRSRVGYFPKPWGTDVPPDTAATALIKGVATGETEAVERGPGKRLDWQQSLILAQKVGQAGNGKEGGCRVEVRTTPTPPSSCG